MFAICVAWRLAPSKALDEPEPADGGGDGEDWRDGHAESRMGGRAGQEE